MTTDSPVRRQKLWLGLTSVITLVAIGALWQLHSRSQAEVCIMIYPAPPGCGAPQAPWIPFLAIGLIIAAFAAAVVVYFTVARSRLAIILLSAGIVLIALAAFGLDAVLQSGVFTPYQPPVY